MITKSHDHPVLTYAQDIKAICRPLEHLNITYFAHVLIDKERKFSAISNNPKFHVYYIENSYYNADIHMAKNDDLGKYVLWDSLECSGKSQQMNKDAEEFNIRHSFTIIDVNNEGKNYYHFSTHLPGKSINHEYLRNLELLKLFILHFNEQIKKSKILSNAHHIKYGINNDVSGFVIKNERNINFDHARSEFLQAMRINFPNVNHEISLREIEILSWLHQGKTLSQIADILKIKEITIKKHISNIKSKTDCYTQFQLGEYFSHLLSS